MTARIVVACEDAGGAAALSPVVKRLVERGDQVELLVGPVAARVLRQRGVLVPSEIANPEELRTRLPLTFESASACLTATSCWGLRLEAQATISSRQASVPSLALIDFWSNYEARLSFPGATGLAAVADRVAVLDPAMKRDLMALGIPQEQLVITGSPAFDDILVRRQSVVRRQGGVLFLSQPLEASYGSDPTGGRFLGYTEGSVLEALAEIVANAGAELLVRPHPREDAAALIARVARLRCRARVQMEGTLEQAVGDASVVVGMTTMALVEAALLGVPSISAQLGRRGTDALPTNAGGLTRGVTDTRELRTLVMGALRGEWVAGTFQPPDAWQGGATERLLEALFAIAG